MSERLIDECREAFEAWTKPAALDLTGSENDWTRKYVYVHSHVEAMWCGWKAAWELQDARVKGAMA